MYTLYPYQVAAVEEINAAFAAGYENVILAAPTGSGKTYIAHTLLEERGGLFAAASLSLQGQYERDFPEIPVIQGHRNYCTNETAHNTDGEVCPVCPVVEGEPPKTRSPFKLVRHLMRSHDEPGGSLSLADLREICAYAVAKEIAIRSPHVNVNPWYLANERKGPDELAGRELLVLDEADEIEGVADTSYSQSYPVATLKEHGWEDPGEYATQAQLVERLTAVLAAFDEHLARKSRILKLVQELYDRLKAEDITLLDAPGQVTLLADRARAKAAVHTGLLAEKADQLERKRLAEFIVEVADPAMLTSWDKTAVTVQTIQPGRSLKERFWPIARRRLLMSGSFVDPMGWAAWVGLDPARTKVVTIEDRFPVERRPITVWKDGPVMSAGAWRVPAMVARMAEAIEGYRNLGRTLVHVKADYQAQALAAYLPDAITYSSGRPEDRDAAVAEFLRRPDGLLIGQSLHRGLDLKDDACRVNIIAKIPLGQLDRITKARSKADSSYYERVTMSTLVQAMGRGMRHEDDWCVVYVLDGAFSVPSRNRMRALLPAHLRAAIVGD